MNSITTIAAERVRSLVWRGDDLVDWASGGAVHGLDGESSSGPVNYAHPFDAAVAEPEGEWAILYTRLGTKALLLRFGNVVREIDRSFYHATRYEYPVCLWRSTTGRVLLCHCPEAYNRLEIEDAETGERLTTGDRDPQDVFHSRLQVSPDGRRLLSAGWCWHPWDVAMVFDLEAALRDPTVLDRNADGAHESGHIGLAEEASACWASATELLLGGSDEEEDEEEALEHPGPRLRPRGIARFDFEQRAVTADIQLDEPPGTMMPVGPAHALALYRHPKLVSLETGNVIEEWPQLDTGTQTSSILGSDLPPMALDPDRRRLAVADPKAIHVLTIDNALLR